MARVPLYNNGAVPINQTGVRVPMVAQNVTAGPAVGQALVGLGQLGTHLAGQMVQANDTRQMMDAQAVMNQHQADQQLFQTKNPDQDTWLPEWQKRVDSTHEYIGGLKLSNGAQQVLNKTVGRWGQLQGTDIEGQAFKQSVGRAKQAVYNTATVAAQDGNVQGIESAISMLPHDFTTREEREQIRVQLHGIAMGVQRSQVKNNVSAALTNNQPETAKSWLDQGLKTGALTPYEHASQMADVNHAQEVNDLMTIANDDPRRAMELATVGEQAKRISGVERVKVVDAAQSKLNELRTTSLKDYTSQIQLGVADKEKFAGKILNDPNLEPVDKANLAVFLDRGPVNDPVTYASLYAEAKTFDGKEGSPEFSRLLSRVDMTLKDDQKSSVISALGESVKGTKDGASKAKAAIYSQMADDLKAGLFGDTHGSLDRPSAVLPQNVRASIDTIKGGLMLNDKVSPEDQQKPDVAAKYERMARVKWWENQPDKNKGEHFNAYMVEDEGLKHAASDRAWAAMTSLEKWMSDNPKATPQEARSYYDSLLTRQRAAGNVTPLLPPPVTEKLDLNAILKRHATNPGK